MSSRSMQQMCRRDRLNGILQQYLNPKSEDKKEREHGSHIFREGDKVMQTNNNYQLEWEIRSKYGFAIDKGLGVFNGCLLYTSGDGGGTVVAKGTPEEVAKVEKSYTGKYLQKFLKS